MRIVKLMQVDRWMLGAVRECGRVQHCRGSAEAFSVELGSAEAVRIVLMIQNLVDNLWNNHIY